MVRDDAAKQPQSLPGHVLGAAPPAAALQRLHETLDPLGQLRALGGCPWHLEISRLASRIHTWQTSELALPGQERSASALLEKKTHPWEKAEPRPSLLTPAPHPDRANQTLGTRCVTFTAERPRASEVRRLEVFFPGFSITEDLTVDATRGWLVPLLWKQPV